MKQLIPVVTIACATMLSVGLRAQTEQINGAGATFPYPIYSKSKVSSEFKSKVGVNTSVNWPPGIGGKGNEGVSGFVTPLATWNSYTHCRTRSVTVRWKTQPASV